MIDPANEQENAERPETGPDREQDNYQFSALSEKNRPDQSANLGFILDIPLAVSVELGRTQMLVNDLLKLGQGSVIELSKLAGETLEIMANQKLLARGEVVVINEKYGIRVTEIISPMERVEKLR
jgi:flagellar motor switch protein FliN/FliY